MSARKWRDECSGGASLSANACVTCKMFSSMSSEPGMSTFLICTKFWETTCDIPLSRATTMLVRHISWSKWNQEKMLGQI